MTFEEWWTVTNKGPHNTPRQAAWLAWTYQVDKVMTLQAKLEAVETRLEAAEKKRDEYEEQLLDCEAIPWPYYDMHVLDEDGSDDMHDSIRGREVDAFLRDKVGIWGVTGPDSPFIFYDIHGLDNQKPHNVCASLGAGFDIYGTAVEMWGWDGVEELNL